MGSSFAGIEIGKRSLMAHSTQIETAGHNISNAGTEGYSRQRVQVSTFEPLYRPDLERAQVAGQIGQGTTVESISRVRDELLDTRIVAQMNEESYWDTRSKYYSMIEQIYNEPDEISVRSNMDKFWQGWQELSLDPSSTAARDAVVTRGQSLTNSIKQQSKSLTAIAVQINGDIDATVRTIMLLGHYVVLTVQHNEDVIKCNVTRDLSERLAIGDTVSLKLGKHSMFDAA